MKEIYKTIPGFKNYQVSTLGNIKSLERMIYTDKGFRKLKERVLSYSKNSDYNYVRLRKNNKYYSYRVHQLVAMAFLNHKPNGYEKVINHINFDKKDNNLENLEIVTQRQNSNKKHIKSTSKYTGVSFNNGMWRSQIRYKGKVRYLGLFNNEYDAHLAYQYMLKLS